MRSDGRSPSASSSEAGSSRSGWPTLLAPDWVYIDFNGVERAKADYEPYIAGVPAGSAPRSPRDLRVRLVGGVAVVDGSSAIPGDDGAPEVVLRFTVVWVDRDGSWLALAHHTSAVSPV